MFLSCTMFNFCFTLAYKYCLVKNLLFIFKHKNEKIISVVSKNTFIIIYVDMENSLGMWGQGTSIAAPNLIFEFQDCFISPPCISFKLRLKFDQDVLELSTKFPQTYPGWKTFYIICNKGILIFIVKGSHYHFLMRNNHIF